ncbi:MAG: RhuM family protein, partial [Leadbetterella sp.]|nr:RhuM family protein [Leadbetterella sp.]
GHTAAEIVYGRADSEKENMGLSTWKNAPKGAIRKTDVSIAKNYLDHTELENLNRIVTMYLDFAELQAKNGKLMYMENWTKKLDAFLQFNEQDILHNPGKVTAAIAKEFAEAEYEKYNSRRLKNYASDFDKALETGLDTMENIHKNLPNPKKK